MLAEWAARAALALAWGGAPAAAQAQAPIKAAAPAHAHGAATLDVAVEGQALTIDLAVPMDSLVGFERAPRSDAERQALAHALARLGDGAALFRPPPDAGCRQTSAQLDAPAGAPAVGTAAAPAGHADVAARYTFQCAQPERLVTLELLLFDAFKRIDRVQVQAVLPTGQRRAVLLRTARVLRLGR